MLRIALPNKGILSEEAFKLVNEAGYRCRRVSSELMTCDTANDIEFYFLRPRDIAVYVGSGHLELGITGKDLAIDSGAQVHEVLPLNFGHSSFFYAVPDNSGLSPDQLGGKRIATSYPHLVELDLQKRGIAATIVKLDGAVEISVQLGVADAIADVVQSGRTLREAGLKTTGSSLLDSQAFLVAHNRETLNNSQVDLLVKRLTGIIVAREYIMIEYDIKKTSVAPACAITPGIESPTISPLSNQEWVSVKAMSKRKEMNRVIDALAGIGAKGIIVTDIRTCRM
jgi:ATP phosphoribosyltransferase